MTCEPLAVWGSRKGVGAWIKAGKNMERLAKMKKIWKGYDKNLLPFSFLENSQRGCETGPGQWWTCLKTSTFLSSLCSESCEEAGGWWMLPILPDLSLLQGKEQKGRRWALLRVCVTSASQKPSYSTKVVKIPGRSMSPPMDRQVISNYFNWTAVWYLMSLYALGKVQLQTCTD